MVEENWLSSGQTADILAISLNNLRQIQHRKQLVWKKKQGREVYYLEQDVLALAEKRSKRVQR